MRLVKQNVPATTTGINSQHPNQPLTAKKNTFQLRKMIFRGKKHRRSENGSTAADDQLSESTPAVEESDISSSSDEHEPHMILEHCIARLSTDNVADNQAGLEKLLDEMKIKGTGKAIITATSSINNNNNNNNHCRIAIAKAIVYGGDKRSVEETLRRALVVFLETDDDDDDDDSDSVDSDYEDRNDDNAAADPNARGMTKSSKAQLNLLALQVLSRSLEQVLTLDDSDEDSDSIDFTRSFWKHTVASIMNTIEVIPDADTTGFSLKCLRLLHSLEPILVKQMLQQSLMPYIIHLKEYGETKQFPMIESEASRLLKRADIQASKYITI